MMIRLVQQLQFLLLSNCLVKAYYNLLYLSFSGVSQRFHHTSSPPSCNLVMHKKGERMRRRTESKPKKRMSAEDRKKAILETTVSFISQFGFWGFTIRDVAQAQNITEAGLLYYFRSKEQLLEETLKYADRTNQIAIAEHLGVEGVTGEVLQDGIAYHCDLGLKAISTGTVETNADPT